MVIRSTIIVTAILLSSTGIALANSVNAEALNLASQKNFTQALDLLSQQSQFEQSQYEHKFLRARILSWAGRYSEAHQELGFLLASNPENPDVRVALGNLHYYQGNLDAAQTEFENVLADYPDYTDAQTGLSNLEKARQAKTTSDVNRWRIDGGLGGSDFDISDLPEWNDQFLRVEYTSDRFSYHSSVQRFKQFGTTDIQLKAGIADAIRGGVDWGLELGITPDSDFRPDYSIGGRLGQTIDALDGVVLYPNINYKFDKYSTAKIHTIQPDITAYLENGTILTGRLIATLQASEPDQLGWLVEGRQPVSSKLQLRAGYAQAPEAIDGFVISTTSLFGGLTYNVHDDLDIHFNLSRDDREDSFIRKSANVSFTYKR